MKELSLFIIFTLFLGCSITEKNILQNEDNLSLEYGKRYYCLKIVDTSIKNNRGFVLELVPTKLETKEVHYPLEYFDKYENGKFKLPLSVEYGEITFLENMPEKRISDVIGVGTRINENEVDEGFWFYWQKVPARYKTFSRKDLTKDGLKIQQEQLKEESHLIKRYVNKCPKVLKDNQYYFEAGNWSEILEYVPPMNCPQTGIIRKIKKALIDLDYDLEEDDKMDEKTTEALKDFQRKNGLKVGNLNIETLKKIGVY